MTDVPVKVFSESVKACLPALGPTKAGRSTFYAVTQVMLLPIPPFPASLAAERAVKDSSGQKE